MGSQKLSAGLTYVLCAAIGVVAAVVTFGGPVLLGTAPFWDNPHGIIDQSAGDMLTALASYDVFVRDEWRWPLLRVEGLGGPGGANIAFSDSAPLLALLGRLIYRVSGATPVLFGPWLVACFMLAAMAPAALVRQLGARSILAAVTAAVIGVSMPALLARWGHITLMAQGLIPLALLAYLRVAGEMRVNAGYLVMLGLCVVALLTNPYLFFMVIAIAVAGLGQAGLNRHVPSGRIILSLVGLAAVLGLMMVVTGHLGGGSLSDPGFGVYSMNLLSPVVPQLSGLFPGATGMIDATGGQYEGFVYLGGGLILLAALAFPTLRRRLLQRVRGHPLLAAVVAGSSLLAASNEVYVGSFHLMSLPLPAWSEAILGIARSSGRLAWIGLYLLAALSVATVARWLCAGPVLVVACGLQWVDAGPLRAMVHDSIHKPYSTIDGLAWRAALPSVAAVVLDPPFLCLVPRLDVSGRDVSGRDVSGGDVFRGDVNAMQHAAAEIQLKAAQAGVPINSIYAARTRPDCRPPALGPGALYVGFRHGAARPDWPCVTGSILVMCHATLPLPTLASLAATIALPGSADGS